MAETLTKPSTSSPDASKDRDKSRGRSAQAQENLQGLEKVFIPYEGFLGTSASKEQLRRSLAQPVQTALQDRASEASFLDALLGTSMLEPPIERHAAIMSDPRFYHPANAPTSSRIVNRLHQTYGNGHVQRVKDYIQAKRTEAGSKSKGKGRVQRAVPSVQVGRESKPNAGLQRRPGSQAGSSNAIQRAPDAEGGKPEPKGPGLLRMREPDQAQKVKRKGQSLLTPSAELCEDLAKRWALKWISMQRFPKPEEPVLNQLVNALKGKVNKWAPRGQKYLTDPARAEEVARTKAVRSVLKQFAKGKPEKKEGLSAKEMEEAKKNLSKALTKALDSTKFFPKWKKNIGEKAKEHWPMLAIAGAGLVGGLVAQAAQTGKWGNVATLAEQLPSLVDTTIDIDEHWKLVIALKESTPIGKEKGATVIAIKPALSLQYKFDDGKTIELSGTANFRFATERAAPFRMRHETFFGLGGTW